MPEQETTSTGKRQAKAVDDAKTELEKVEEKLAAAQLRLDEVEAGANMSKRKSGHQDSDACQAKSGNVEQQNPQRARPKPDKTAAA